MTVESSERPQSVRNFAFAEKREFIDAATRDFSETRLEVDRLRRVVARSTGKSRTDAEKRLKVIDERLTAASARLDRTQAATEAEWSDMQRRHRQSRVEMRVSLDQMRQWLATDFEHQ